MENLIIVKWPAYTRLFNPSKPMFDQLLVERRKALETRDYALADAMREYAEFVLGRTINNTKEECPMEQSPATEPGHDYQQYRKLSCTEYLKKFKDNFAFKHGDIEGLIKSMNNSESRFGKMYGLMGVEHIVTLSGKE